MLLAASSALATPCLGEGRGALVMVFGLNGVGLAVIRDGDLGILVSKFVSNYWLYSYLISCNCHIHVVGHRQDRSRSWDCEQPSSTDKRTDGVGAMGEESSSGEDCNPTRPISVGVRCWTQLGGSMLGVPSRPRLLMGLPRADAVAALRRIHQQWKNTQIVMSFHRSLLNVKVQVLSCEFLRLRIPWRGVTPFFDSKKTLDSQLFRRVAPFGHHQSLEAQAGHGSTPDDRCFVDQSHSVGQGRGRAAAGHRLGGAEGGGAGHGGAGTRQSNTGGSEILGMLCTMPNDFVVQPWYLMVQLRSGLVAPLYIFLNIRSWFMDKIIYL